MSHVGLQTSILYDSSNIDSSFRNIQGGKSSERFDRNSTATYSRFGRKDVSSFSILATISQNEPVGRRSLSEHMDLTERVLRSETDLLKTRTNQS